MKFPDFKTIREKTLNLNFAVGLIVAGIFVIGLSLLLLLPFRDYWLAKPIDNALVGQFGDFIGGIAGSFWALAGVIMFYVALHEQRQDFANNREDSKTNRKILEAQLKEFQLQQVELAETRKVFKEQSETLRVQRFESVFFNMINMLNELVGSITLDETLYYGSFDSNTHLGRHALSKIVTRFEQDVADQVRKASSAEEAMQFYERLEEDVIVSFNGLIPMIKIIEQIVVLIFDSKLEERRNRYVEIFKSNLDPFQLSYIGLVLIARSERYSSLLVRMNILEFYDAESFERLQYVNFAHDVLRAKLHSARVNMFE